MYRSQKTIAVNEHRLPASRGLVEEIARLVQQIVTAAKKRLFSNSPGNRPPIRWPIEYDSLAQYEATRDQWRGAL